MKREKLFEELKKFKIGFVESYQKDNDFFELSIYDNQFLIHINMIYDFKNNQNHKELRKSNIDILNHNFYYDLKLKIDINLIDFLISNSNIFKVFNLLNRFSKLIYIESFDNKELKLSL